MYFTIYYSLSRVWETLPETARCCSDRVFYNTLSTFSGFGGALGDRSMLLRQCILQYIAYFPGSRRRSWRPLKDLHCPFVAPGATLLPRSPALLPRGFRARVVLDRNILLTSSGLLDCRCGVGFVQLRQPLLLNRMGYRGLSWNSVDSHIITPHPGEPASAKAGRNRTAGQMAKYALP